MASLKLCKIFCIVFVAWAVDVGAAPPDDAPALNINTHQAPPAWALKQRLLLEENTRAATIYYNHYWDERGWLKCIERWSIVDGVDDVMQGLANLSLLYALGADPILLDMHNRAFEGNIEQYSTKPVAYAPDWGIFHDDFVMANDWHHHGEHYASFNQLVLADPHDETFRERALRFAGFYLNEGLPEGAEPNYDFDLRLIRSGINGSGGAYLNITHDFLGHSWEAILGRPGHEDGAACRVNVKGDLPMNLGATVLAANAFTLSGDEKYREWLVGYVDAWAQRAEQNGGIFPANVGLSGEMGEHWDGKWWRHMHGFWRPFREVLVGMECAMLMTGDTAYMEPIRRQIHALLDEAVEHDGKLYPPAARTDDGWTGRQRFGRQLVRLYLTDFRDDDLQLIEDEIDRFGRRDRFNYNADFFYSIDDTPWLYYLLGKNTEFPERMLDADLSRIRTRMNQMRGDDSVDWERRSDHSHRYNPVATHALMNMVAGALGPNHAKGSHVLLAEVWPFDPERNRPGLPPDVALLVDGITTDGITLHVVNLSQTDTRTLVLQAGAYGEHRFGRATYRQRSTEINSNYLVVRLEPGCGGHLTFTMDRYSNQPRAGFSWAEEKR